MLKKYALPAALIICCLIIMIGGSEDRIRKADFFGRTMFFPFARSINRIHSNREMRTQINLLQREVVEQSLKNLALQNQLREYQNSAALVPDAGVKDFEIAEVIGYSGQFHERSLIANKGIGSGITSDSPVITALGIVGKVVRVANTYCVILPFTNPQFQLPVMNLKSSVQGILQAGIGGSVAMNMIRLGSEIAVGDTIVTSNLSQIFPKGYPVGTVSRIKESQDNLFISAEINPFTFVENLEHVFIIKQRNY